MNRRDGNLLQQMNIVSQRAQNMMNTGLKAQDILDGISISHEDFIRLVQLASSVPLLEHQLKGVTNVQHPKASTTT